MGLKKIPIKKNYRKGVPHPNHSLWHKYMSPEEKQARSKHMSEVMTKYHANKSKKAKKLTRIRMSEKTRLFLDSLIGREEKLYRVYLSRNYQLGLKGEERKRVLAKRGAGRKKAWDKVSPEDRKKMGQRILQIRSGHTLEFTCEREHDFCGVVTEKAEECYA